VKKAAIRERSVPPAALLLADGGEERAAEPRLASPVFFSRLDGRAAKDEPAR
jgi:hypothetical protein